MDITKLNKKYLPLTPEQRIRSLYEDFDRILFTSSFGTTSVFLLHLFNKINPKQVVYFLDTSYHFNETHEYKNQLIELLKLQVKDVKPEEWKNKFTQQDKTWNSDPDLCCSINKVEPLDKIKPDFRVWVSGLMASQNKFRGSLKVFEEKDGILKFFPLIDLSEKDAFDYIKSNGLPEHPLLKAGYNSVGCFHCTVAGKGRSGRWVNKSKTECGLHL
jgi:phosphoadenosine phosphosulfate reductase